MLSKHGRRIGFGVETIRIILTEGVVYLITTRVLIGGVEVIHSDSLYIPTPGPELENDIFTPVRSLPVEVEVLISDNMLFRIHFVIVMRTRPLSLHDRASWAMEAIGDTDLRITISNLVKADDWAVAPQIPIEIAEASDGDIYYLTFMAQPNLVYGAKLTYSILRSRGKVEWQ